ncbi:unnamed protein product, partial [Vitis vinifera]|uniref:Uncharacterized protein n=1 Tax=Vitis vinifera TaxID=29760 RepID=D7U7G3_VITVI
MLLLHMLLAAMEVEHITAITEEGHHSHHGHGICHSGGYHGLGGGIHGGAGGGGCSHQGHGCHGGGHHHPH